MKNYNYFAEDSTKKHPFPCPTTYRTALSHYIDITSNPRTHVLKELVEHTTDEKVSVRLKMDLSLSLPPSFSLPPHPSILYICVCFVLCYSILFFPLFFPSFSLFQYWIIISYLKPFWEKCNKLVVKRTKPRKTWANLLVINELQSFLTWA